MGTSQRALAIGCEIPGTSTVPDAPIAFSQIVPGAFVCGLPVVEASYHVQRQAIDITTYADASPVYYYTAPDHHVHLVLSGSFAPETGWLVPWDESGTLFIGSAIDVDFTANGYRFRGRLVVRSWDMVPGALEIEAIGGADFTVEKA